MGLFGSLIALPFRVVNAPMRVVESLMDNDISEDDRILSKPLDVLADELEKVDE